MIEWIMTADRKPTKADADEYNCVLVYHALSGVMVTGWHRVAENAEMIAWAKTPEGPKGTIHKVRTR